MRLRLIGPALLCLVGVLACRGETSPPQDRDLIDRETFIVTYVDLRVAASRSGRDTISADERSEILARHGVDAESLLAFADAHGSDVDYMSQVWNEVERRIEEGLTEEGPS